MEAMNIGIAVYISLFSLGIWGSLFVYVLYSNASKYLELKKEIIKLKIELEKVKSD